MKKKGILCLLIISSIILAACGKKETNATSEEGDKPDKVVIEDADTEQDKNESETNTEEPTEVENKDKVLMKVIYPDEQYLKFESETVEVEEITPAAILNQLVIHEVMSPEVSVLSFEKVTDYGEAAINLNLSQAYGSYLAGMGSTGEYYCLGALCNSFIDNYDVVKIKVQVEGQSLQTGHNLYDSYLLKFQN
ncbi:hypothetical protein M2145_002490 [Lachnospiraceae bacterium PF1-21]|uniref:GerMN domain-containing protein n=1 Tax=Ohessyouella blattaphilus TaxID=2949333 RepID=UPI003E32E229